MAWTYDSSELATNPVMQLRLLIGDTLPRDPQFQDAELEFMLSQRSTIYGAAANACRALSTQMSRQADSTDGNTRVLYSSRARAYAAAALRYEQEAMVRSAGMPYSGHLTTADYWTMLNDPDRIAGQFNIGMTDDLRLGRQVTEPDDVGGSAP
jgi:hypothetical protein